MQVGLWQIFSDFRCGGLNHGLMGKAGTQSTGTVAELHFSLNSVQGVVVKLDWYVQCTVGQATCEMEQ